MDWLVHTQGVFVAPQYQLYGDAATADRKAWSVPDFVALDFKNRAVLVVEVSADGKAGGLLDKVRRRDDQWFQKLGPQLRGVGAIEGDWKFKVMLFLRKKEADRFQKQFADAADVITKPLEDIANYWEWEWPSEKAAKEAKEG